MAGAADDGVAWRYRFTLYTLLFSLQTKDRVRAIKNWELFVEWRNFFDELQSDHDFLARFPPVERDGLKHNAASVAEQFRVWEGRAPPKQWVLWPIYMVLPPVLVSGAYWVIGEPVFALRSHAYYVVIILTVLRCAFSRYATGSIFRRLHRDTWATLPVQTVMSLPPAFIPGCRFLYKEGWYISISIVATCVLVYCIQYHALFKELWRDRSVRASPGPGVGADEQILARLDAVEEGFEFYEKEFGGYRCNYVHNIQDVLVREGAGKVIKILSASLSPEARRRRHPGSISERPVGSVSDRKIKRWFAISYFVAAFFTIGTLVFQWGSFAQAFMALYAVGLMLILMMIYDHYVLDAFLDFYTPKMAFLFWSLPLVNCLLIGHPTRFSDDPRLFWAIYAALMVANLFGSDLLVYYAKRYLRKKFSGYVAS